MAGSLQGRIAIVTGSGRGIGRGIAVEMAREGAKVVVASRSQESIDETLKEIGDLGGGAIGAVCDVGSHGDIKATVARTVETFGGLDILVNNAQGHGTREKPAATPIFSPLENFHDGEWDFAMLTGPTASYRFMKAAFPHLRASGRGRIINFASALGMRGSAGSAAYNAAKEAIRALTRTAANEWGRYGITCNIFSPAIETDSLRNYVNQYPEEAAATMLGIPMRRWGDINKDGGRVAVFIAGDDASYLTGMTFMVDGGKFMSP